MGIKSSHDGTPGTPNQFNSRITIMGYKVAVVGATGNVGREMLSILAKRKFPAAGVAALPSRKSTGQQAPYAAGRLRAKALRHNDFPNVTSSRMPAGGG